MATDLRGQGIDVHTGYRSGHHDIDLVHGSGDRAIGLCFGVHPKGPRAHIERRLAAVQAGWDLRDAHDSAWGHRAAGLVVELVVEARRRSG